MQRLLCFVLLVLLGACTYPPVERPTNVCPNIPAIEYAVISYGNEMERDAKLFLLDSRACFNVDGVLSICMRFRTQRLVDVCEGRDLIVQLVEGFLNRINTDGTIACALNPYPLTADRLQINIAFESFYVRYIDPLYMGRIMLQGGVVYYYSYDALDPDTVLWKQRVEPYAKALRFSRFRNEDLMQFPKVCVGFKAHEHHNDEKLANEPYDHVISRTQSIPCGLNDVPSEPARSPPACINFFPGPSCVEEGEQIPCGAFSDGPYDDDYPCNECDPCATNKGCGGLNCDSVSNGYDNDRCGKTNGSPTNSFSQSQAAAAAQPPSQASNTPQPQLRPQADAIPREHFQADEAAQERVKLENASQGRPQLDTTPRERPQIGAPAQGSAVPQI